MLSIIAICFQLYKGENMTEGCNLVGLKGEHLSPPSHFFLSSLKRFLRPPLHRVNRHTQGPEYMGKVPRIKGHLLMLLLYSLIYTVRIFKPQVEARTLEDTKEVRSQITHNRFVAYSIFLCGYDREDKLCLQRKVFLLVG